MGIRVSIPNRVDVNAKANVTHTVQVLKAIELNHHLRLEVVWPTHALIGTAVALHYVFLLLACLVKHYDMALVIAAAYALGAALYFVVHFVQCVMAPRPVDRVILQLHGKGLDVYGSAAALKSIREQAPPNADWPAVVDGDWGLYFKVKAPSDVLGALDRAGFRFERVTPYAAIRLELWKR